MGLDQLSYERPTEQFLYVTREPVEAICPRCKSSNVCRYPIWRFNGFFIGSKCQDCFYILSLDKPKPADRWPPFKAAAWDWPAAPSEGGRLPSK